MDNIISFLSGGFIGVTIREAFSGIINEWIKDIFAIKRNKTKVKYYLGKKILNTISNDISNLTECPPSSVMTQLILHTYGHSKKLSQMMSLYMKVRWMLFKQLPKFTKTKSIYEVSKDDLEMFTRFRDELQIMSLGLAIETHYLMGNNFTNYWWETIKYFYKYKILKQKVSSFYEPSLTELIKKSNESHM